MPFASGLVYSCRARRKLLVSRTQIVYSLIMDNAQIKSGFIARMSTSVCSYLCLCATVSIVSCAPRETHTVDAAVVPTSTSASMGATSLSSSTSPAVCPVPRAPTSVSSADRGTQAYDRDVWQTLLYHHAKIRRSVTLIDKGVSAVTESDDPAVATLIKDHALAMRERMVEGRQVRVWDPVFKELFARHEHVKLVVELTEKGVRIVETGDDPETVRLLRSHASGVTDFVRLGSAAAQRETPYVND